MRFETRMEVWLNTIGQYKKKPRSCLMIMKKTGYGMKTHATTSLYV